MSKMLPAERKLQILHCAHTLAIEIGYSNITRDKVAEYANISSSLIANYFPKMNDLKQAVLQHAIENETITILLHVVCIKDDAIKSLPVSLKYKIISKIIEIAF